MFSGGINMKRAQVYLEETQWEILDELSHRLKKSVAELIRNAVEKIYKREKNKFSEALNGIYGLWALG